MSAVVRLVSKPFLSIHKNAVRKVAAMAPSPLQRQVEVHESSGEDLCVKAAKEYFSWQYQLLPYRTQRAVEEWNYIRQGGISLATATFRDYLLLLRFLTKMLCIFIASVMLGRNSIFPPLGPNSPLFEANEVNIIIPNDRSRLGLH